MAAVSNRNWLIASTAATAALMTIGYYLDSPMRVGEPPKTPSDLYWWEQIVIAPLLITILVVFFSALYHSFSHHRLFWGISMIFFWPLSIVYGWRLRYIKFDAIDGSPR